MVVQTRRLPLALFLMAAAQAGLTAEDGTLISATPLLLTQGGTAEKPAVYDGKGVVIDLGIDVTGHSWKKDGDIWISDGPLLGRAPLAAGQLAGLFLDELPLRLPRDLAAEKAHPERKEHCYLAPAALKPGQMGYAEDGSLYFRWPTNRTPVSTRLILPPKVGVSAVTIACSNIIVRNITATHAANDGFNIHGKWTGIRLENVRALSNADEGISAHDDVEMAVENAEIAWNGSVSGGVADVDRCVTQYRNCRVHDNLGAGFFLAGKRHEVTDSVIYNQALDFWIRPGIACRRERIEWYKAYVYKQSAGVGQQLEVFFPPGWKPSGPKVPGVLLFHGGGWSGGSLSQFRPFCAYLASRGLVAATANYRMLPTGEGGTQAGGANLRKRVCITDAKSAVRWMKQHAGELGVDPQRLIVGGGSAGGHISVLATTNPGLDDPADPKEYDTSVAAYLLFNPAFTAKDSSDPEVDVLKHLTADFPPALLLFGTKDTWKPGSDAALRRLKELGNTTAEMWLAEGQEHGFYREQPWRNWTLSAVDRFLVDHGFLKGTCTLTPPADGAKLIKAP